MPIRIDPAISTRVKTAWAQLTPDQQAAVQPSMQNAHDQTVQVAQSGAPPAAPAASHCLTLAQTALYDDPDAILDKLDAGIFFGIGPEGVIWGTGKWEQLDPGWVESFAVFLESLFSGKHPFVTTPQTIAIPDTVQIALTGDWGTGNSWRLAPNLPPSVLVGQQIAALNPGITIHLGDVYYSGTQGEEQDHLVSLWPQGASGSFTLNSNHEMYSGSKPYFSAIASPPFDKQAGCSYFSLENSNWIIVALDSAYFAPEGSLYVNGLLYPEGSAPNAQSAFLQQKAQEAQASGKRLILLTHHNGLDDTGTQQNALFAQVSAVLPAGGPVYWYYGHEHIAAVYMPQGAAGLLCRCCGHGALPWAHASDLASGTGVIWYEDRNAGDPDIPQRVCNGFAVLKLDGPNIQEVFYDETGGIAWSSS